MDRANIGQVRGHKAISKKGSRKVMLEAKTTWLQAFLNEPRSFSSLQCICRRLHELSVCLQVSVNKPT